MVYISEKGTTNGHEWTRKFSPQKTQNKQKSLAAGPTIPEGFNDKNKTLIMNDATGSGSSAV